MRVLLVHPEPNERDVIVQALGDEGFEVIAVGGTSAGIRQFHQQDPGIVIVAHEPSVVDGEQFCARLRSESDVPIIVIGGNRGEATLLQVLRSGADAYLQYPTARELVARVRSLLRRTKPKGNKPEGDSESRSVRLQRGLFYFVLSECRVFLRLSSGPGVAMPHGRPSREVRGRPGRRSEEPCICPATVRWGVGT